MPPRLTIAKTVAAQAVLQWPTNYVGYRMNSATNLGAPSLSRWRLFTNVPTVNGTNYTVSVGTTNPTQFFRLRKP